MLSVSVKSVQGSASSDLLLVPLMLILNSFLLRSSVAYADHITSNSLKAVFYKFYLVHS